MTRIQAQLTINRVIAVLVGAVVLSYNANAQQQVTLTPDDYSVWQDTWLRGEVDELWITDVDATGFRYSVVSRVRPASPNTEVLEEGTASFLGPVAARSQESGDTFVLRIAPDDRHDRDITYQDVAYKHLRTTFRAGFDCDKAATSVELAVCRNERIAAGDLELNRLYGELLAVLSAEERPSLRSDQRAWLTRRNRDCVDGDDVDSACLARLYSDRLVAMARMRDPALGAGSSFDATYVTAMLARGVALNEDLATRLAMFPHETDCSGVDWTVGPNDAVLVEHTCHGAGHALWPPIDLDFPIEGYYFSVMWFVDPNGMVWTATHTEIDMSLDYQELVQLAQTSGHLAWKIWDGAGRSHFSIRSETGFGFDLRPSCLDNFTERDHPFAAIGDPPPLPDMVASWVARHPVLTGDRTCCCG